MFFAVVQLVKNRYFYYTYFFKKSNQKYYFYIIIQYHAKLLVDFDKAKNTYGNIKNGLYITYIDLYSIVVKEK